MKTNTYFTKSLVSVIFSILIINIFSGCGRNVESVFEREEEEVGETFPDAFGGPAIVKTSDLSVYGTLFGEDEIVRLNEGDRITLIAEFDESYPEGWRRIQLDDGTLGWLRYADKAHIDLVYYILENTPLYTDLSEDVESDILLPSGAEVVVLDGCKVSGKYWSKIECDGKTGWIESSSLSDGLDGLVELAYRSGISGDNNKTVEYLKLAAKSGAFVDYSNPNGPWAVRVPRKDFRVFGPNTDYKLSETSAGTVAIDKTGKYLAFKRDEGKQAYLRVYDLKKSSELFYSPDLNDFKWSPLGQFLAYTDGVQGIYSLRMFWTNRGTVMKSFQLGGEYGWSPDGHLVAFTGIRNAESTDYYLPMSDTLPLDNVFTTVELYDPFGMLWSVVLESTPECKYEFVEWKSNKVIVINKYKGAIDDKGIVRYVDKPESIDWQVNRGSLISPRELSPGRVKKKKDDGGSIEEKPIALPDKESTNLGSGSDNPQ